MNDILAIVRRNFFTPIVIAILTLAVILMVLGESRDAIFVSSVIVLNTMIGVVQEIRAQRELKKLELMSAPRARRMVSDGTIEEVLFTELVVGDTIALQAGDEVPADVVVHESRGLEIDESILTGEEAPVEKAPEDEALAGTVIVAGAGVAEVQATGENTHAGKMTSKLKRYTPERTPLQRNINLAITILTYGALALALLIAITYSVMGADLVSIFKTITAGATSVIPEGLLLASSLLLAYGSLKLAAARVLPQKLAAIEAMALLNVLAVDKTGTLTSPEITFEHFVSFAGDDTADETLLAVVSAVSRETSAGNATGDALIAALPEPGSYTAKDILAFSSQRKYSGARIAYKGATRTVFMGAPEFLGVLAPLSNEQTETVQSLAKAGARVLLVVEFDDQSTKLREFSAASGRPLGLLVLSNTLREGVTETIEFLQNNDVKMRVISGDNPETVRYIAERAGVQDTQKVITGAELDGLDGADWEDAVRDTTIFARVLPHQKEQLIAAYQRDHKFTGMVGDGVNDALALKKADLGVAMHAGASASRRVSDIVLLDNSFTSLPMGMRLGNRIMQAIELIAVLFFHKVLYSIVLLVATMAIGMVYPFAPRHVTFMNIFLVTMPTIMWTLFPPKPTHRINPSMFWRDTLRSVVPIALLTGLGITAVYSLLSRLHPDQPESVATTTVIVTTFFGIYLVFLASRMLAVVDDRSAKLARTLYILAALFMASISFGFGFTRDFFDFTSPAWQGSWPVLLLVVNVAVIQWWIAGKAANRLKERS